MAMREPTPPTRRRWFQFSLGTLFVVVTVFALWLGWQAKIVRDRKNFLMMLNDYEAAQIENLPPGSPVSIAINYPSFEEPTLPFWRHWMGDKARGVILLPVNATDEHLRMARELFPEVKYFGKDGVRIPNE
jgi:hypothetical protein